MLVRANRTEIERVKNQDDIALARKVGKFDFFLRLIFQGEVWSGLSHGYRHEAS
jgi:hypothetical protein